MFGLMRTCAPAVSGNVAVMAQDLVLGREVLADDLVHEPIGAASLLSSFLGPVVIDVINRQESVLRFPAAVTDAAVASNCFAPSSFSVRVLGRVPFRSFFVGDATVLVPPLGIDSILVLRVSRVVRFAVAKLATFQVSVFAALVLRKLRERLDGFAFVTLSSIHAQIITRKVRLCKL